MVRSGRQGNAQCPERMWRMNTSPTRAPKRYNRSIVPQECRRLTQFAADTTSTDEQYFCLWETRRQLRTEDSSRMKIPRRSSGHSSDMSCSKTSTMWGWWREEEKEMRRPRRNRDKSEKDLFRIQGQRQARRSPSLCHALPDGPLVTRCLHGKYSVTQTSDVTRSSP